MNSTDIKNAFPSLSNNLFTKNRHERILYLNPQLPDWISINIKYKPIFDLFDGSHSVENISKYIRENYAEESDILVNQVINLLRNTKIFSHNSAPVEESKCKKSLKLKSVYLTLTDACNLNCKYCYTKERVATKTSDLSQWKSYIDKVLSISETICFTFTGGEPLLVPFLFDLAEYICNGGSKSLLLTNGICISNEAIAKKISDYFSQTRISLDSLHEERNARLRGPEVLKKVESAVRLLNKAKAEFILQATVTQINKDEVEEFSAHFNNRVNFQPLYQMGAAKGCLDLMISGMEYYQALSQAGISGYRQGIHNFRGQPCKRCSMGIEEISIGPNGGLYPCHMLHYPELRIGNLNEDDIKELYYKSPLLKRLRAIDVDTIENCSSCEVRNFCGAACRARIYLKKQDLRCSDSFCVFEKESILDALIHSFG